VGEGILNALLREGLGLTCLELRFVDLQLALLPLSVAEALDGLFGTVGQFSQGLPRGFFEGDVLSLIEEGYELSDGRTGCYGENGIGGSFIETGRTLGLSGC
jgi:hypothetical protein